MTFFKPIFSFVVALLLVSATLGQQSNCPNGQCPQQRMQLRPTWKTRVVQQPIFVLPTVQQPVVSQPVFSPPLAASPSTQSPAARPVTQVPFELNATHAAPIILNPLAEEVFIDSSQLEAVAQTRDEDRFEQVTRATIRVTVGGVCGSGTVVGRDGSGNTIVLTNAHVAGTTRGKTVNLERWEVDGSSETGNGTIIAAGYGRGMSVDFALLKCNAEFATDVTPIPLADRYPDLAHSITTFGCPRCEWPSLQVLKLNRAEGQVLTWKPEAIGGRSGSSVIEHTEAGPRVIALLTWGGGGEGLGQSTPFLLSAMRGKLPASLETLPLGVREVGAVEDDGKNKSIFEAFRDPIDGDENVCRVDQKPDSNVHRLAVYQVPASIDGEALKLPLNQAADNVIEKAQETNNEIIDAITEERLLDRLRPNRVQPNPNDDCTENGILNRDRTGPIRRGVSNLGWGIVVLGFGAICWFVGFAIGKNSLSRR